MLSANNIKNLEAVNLPEVDEHTEYDITELYEDYVTLNTYLKSIIKIGKLIKYTIRENNIQYRGITTPLYVYKDNKQFKKMDIYGGINKIANADKIVCRIMPVMHNGSVKWIGIYLKTAL